MNSIKDEKSSTLLSFSSFSVFMTPTPSPTCFDGQFQLANNYYNYNTSLYSVSGYLTGCVNGTFAPVCGEADIGRTELTYACYYTNRLTCKLSMCSVCAVCERLCHIDNTSSCFLSI